MNKSFQRQTIIETGDPQLQLQPLPKLAEILSSMGMSADSTLMRGAVQYDDRMADWLRSTQQQLAEQFSKVNETTVQGGGAGVPAP